MDQSMVKLEYELKTPRFQIESSTVHSTWFITVHWILGIC